MKHKLLLLGGAALCALSLSSCYVYDSPMTWVDPCPRPVYGRGIYSPPVYRSYGSSYGYHHHRPHCAPPPPVCHSPFGHRGRLF
ncbi:MAG: hypothetical protein JNG86_00410 [Verrucomicrobiaceae bacterium]|nr:hypothetical protein [Verrucomicrobiaceae bacterium]